MPRGSQLVPLGCICRACPRVGITGRAVTEPGASWVSGALIEAQRGDDFPDTELALGPTLPPSVPAPPLSTNSASCWS